MKKRVFRNMVLIALSAVIVFGLLLMGVMYHVFANRLRAELKGESVYITAALNENIDRERFFAAAAEGADETRITWIAADGTVLADNRSDPATMENHANRLEVQTALANGNGYDSRESVTLGQMTFYYATRLADGTVLRVAGTQKSVFGLLASLLPFFLAMFLLTAAVAGGISRRLTQRIVRPVNAIDLDNPLDNVSYEELTPLLTKMAQQNDRIAVQMRELSAKQTEFVAITEHMAEALVVMNARGEVLMLNQAALRLFHAKREEAAGKYVLELKRDADLSRAVSAAAGGRTTTETMACDGRTYQILASPVIENHTLTGEVLLMLDITEHYQAEQMRREFSANVSHELKTPLTSILGYAELMKSGMAQGNDAQQFAGRIYDEARRLIQLVEDIIHLSRLDEAREADLRESVNLTNVCAEVVKRLEKQATEMQVTLENTADGDIFVRGNERTLDEMVDNLVENAIKYNVKGGRVAVSLSRKLNAIELIVADTGIGIAPQEIDKIFERFYRVDKSHSKAIGGTGLGLSIVKHAAMCHGANIQVESEIGKGTRMIVQFPTE